MYARTGVRGEDPGEEAKLRSVVQDLENKKNTKAKQHSHVTWLWDGNRSTRYLMVVASARRKANRVKVLRKEDGVVEVKEGEDLNNYVCSFFQDLFTSARGTRMVELIDKVQPRVTSAMRDILWAEVTREEVKVALDHIGISRHPGQMACP